MESVAGVPREGLTMNITFTVIKCAPKRKPAVSRSVLRLVAFLLGLGLGLVGLVSAFLFFNL